MSTVNNNHREQIAQTFLAHGVILSSICTLKAAKAQTARRTCGLGLAALLISSTTIGSAQATFDEATVDVNSFFKNLVKPLREGAGMARAHVLNRLENIDCKTCMDRIQKAVADFFRFFNEN